MISFALLAVIIIVLAVYSCLPDGAGLYTSHPIIALWGALSLTALYYMIKRRLYKRKAVFFLHIAFLVILAGAAVTHFSGTSSQVHLRVGQNVKIGSLKVELKSFTVDNYPGTVAPRDFISEVLIDGKEYRVSMNNIAKVDGYRFFQTSYDHDLMGSTLTVTHDPYGIAVTYVGYDMLFVFMCLCLLPKKRSIGPAIVMLLLPSLTYGGSTPSTVPSDIASELGQLYVYHNDRVAPLSTLADGFSRKISGSSTYRGLSAEQVLAGWMFYYDAWKVEPCIKIKDASTREKFGGRSHVSIVDYFTDNGYLLQDGSYAEANEKFAIASSAATGSIWKIFPYTESDGSVFWLSPVDEMPAEMPVDSWHITRHSLNYLAQLIEEGNWDEARNTIIKIAEYQRKQASGCLPSARQVACERFYMRCASAPWAVVAMLVIGILLLIFIRQRVALCVVSVALLWIGSLITTNWIASGHIPMTNGGETMLLMAFCSLATSLVLHRKSHTILPLGLIVGALAMCVAVMGQQTPQITQLIPVLNSPLLSIHVLTVMLAYSLLAIMALSGVLWLCGRRDMMAVSRAMLCPAVFLLVAGIFIGAVWANVSWGRYWGWDPKEVWALITMLIYAFPLHNHIFKAFRRDKVYAIFCIVAFLSVLMTYFGVNYLLGGLHSYN